MAREQIVGGSIEAVTDSKKRIRVRIISGRITFLDGTRNEVSPAVRVRVPEGTIESLRPLLQEAFNLFSPDQDEGGYWEKIAQEAPFSPAKACRKLRRAGIDHRQAARLVIENEPIIQKAVSWGNIKEDTFESFVSLASAVIRREYHRKE